MSIDADAMVEEAIKTYRAGDTAKARTLLKEAVDLDAEHERAWMWLSALGDTAKTQRAYLRRALRINTNNPIARKAWQLLKPKPDDSPGVMFIESYAAAEGMSSAGDEKAKPSVEQPKPIRLWLLGTVFAVSPVLVSFLMTPFWIRTIPALVIYPEISLFALVACLVGFLVFGLAGSLRTCGLFLLWGLVAVVSFVLRMPLILTPVLLIFTALVWIFGGVERRQRGRIAVEMITGILFVGMLFLILGPVLFASLTISLEDDARVEKHNYYLITRSGLWTGDERADVVLYKCNQFNFACEEVERYYDCVFQPCWLVVDSENNVGVASGLLNISPD